MLSSHPLLLKFGFLLRPNARHEILVLDDHEVITESHWAKQFGNLVLDLCSRRVKRQIKGTSSWPQRFHQLNSADAGMRDDALRVFKNDVELFHQQVCRRLDIPFWFDLHRRSVMNDIAVQQMQKLFEESDWLLTDAIKDFNNDIRRCAGEIANKTKLPLIAPKQNDYQTKQ